MIIDQILIAAILAKTFDKGMVEQSGKQVEFDALAGRIAKDLEKYSAVHNRVEQLEVGIKNLQVEREKLQDGCEHPTKRMTLDQGIETIFCQVCGKLFDRSEVDNGDDGFTTHGCV